MRITRPRRITPDDLGRWRQDIKLVPDEIKQSRYATAAGDELGRLSILEPTPTQLIEPERIEEEEEEDEEERVDEFEAAPWRPPLHSTGVVPAWMLRGI